MSDQKPKDKDIEDNSFLAAIGYIGIVCIVPLFLKRNSKFAQFHAKQALLLLIIEVVAWIIPPIAWIFYILAVILSVMGIKAALEGKYWELPLIVKYAKKINLQF